MTPLFLSLYQAVVFWVIFVLYFASVLMFAIRYGRKAGKNRQDPTPLILFAIVVVIVIGYARIGVLPNWLFYPGEVLLIVGVLSRFGHMRF